MRHTKKILFMGLCALLLFALIPSQTETIKISYIQADTIHSTVYSIYPESFNKTDNDYCFLKSTVRNNNSAITGFSPPPLGEHWMIEVTTLTQIYSLDVLNGSIFDENLSSSLNRWIPSAAFPDDEYILGAYNTSLYWIDPNFLSIFPLPFFVPLNLTAVNNTLEQLLSVNYSGIFQWYIFLNGTELWESVPPEFAVLLNALPSRFHSIIVAYNGTIPIIGGSQRLIEANGTNAGDLLLEAVYFEDGELNFIRESEWGNSTGEWKWNSRYKLVSPVWELLYGMLEGMLLPGSESSGGGGGIPGFTCVALFLGLMTAIGIIYLRKPKQEIII